MENGTKPGFTDLHKVLAFLAVILTILAGLVSIMVVVIGVLWGYFSLQRDTSDNKAAVVESRIQFAAANSDQKKQIQDGQEKTSAEIKALVEAVNKRFVEDEKVVRDINDNGTNYGRTKVDTRMAEIAEVKGRVEKVESAFADLRPIIQRTGDRVEQMWGDYNSRAVITPPVIDARRQRTR